MMICDYGGGDGGDPGHDHGGDSGHGGRCHGLGPMGAVGDSMMLRLGPMGVAAAEAVRRRGGFFGL